MPGFMQASCVFPTAGRVPAACPRSVRGDGHAVLTVKTDKGEFILDNQVQDILLWSDTNYRFVKRQSPVNAGEWLEIESLPEPLVSSVSR